MLPAAESMRDAAYLSFFTHRRAGAYVARRPRDHVKSALLLGFLPRFSAIRRFHEGDFTRCFF
jgi:hypothetical protein